MFSPRSFYLIVLLVGAQAGPVVDLGYGQYEGSVENTTLITSFLGIRFAAAPTGDLRFRAPQPPVTVKGVQPATVESNYCPQSGDGTSPTNPFNKRSAGPDEDCLFLNVFYPSNGAGKPNGGDLPVIVWIHGGGYVAGGAIGVPGGDLITQSNRGVVTVVIQYRLGLFGFLPGAEVKKGGTLNAGLLDQDYALRWINKHISKFGGDPSKVAIWGDSAGAGSVLQHVVANGGKTEPQLFRVAMTSSTFLPSQYAYNDRIPELLFSEVVAQSNCTKAKDALTCLRGVDQTVLANINAKINNAAFYGVFQFVPVVDGEFITQRPTLSMLEQKVNGEVLLSVTNTFEGTNFVNQSVPTEAGAYSHSLFPKLTTLQTNAIAKLYRGLGTETFQDSAIMGESIFICPTFYLLHAFQGRAYKGEFAVPPGLHGNDYAYYFPSGGPPPAPYNTPSFTNAFAQSFTSFALNLDPNVKVKVNGTTDITPKWSKYDLGNTEMLFNMTADGTPDIKAVWMSKALLERCVCVIISLFACVFNVHNPKVVSNIRTADKRKL
ncbi:Alpha/Beta hydrolase protein [Mycena alexandri]|uniref:Carboxylic ester hydrolase n=1 Tax=Mycena alexandri TaxID=1745969 RepID=A0AAD6SGP8_9AGAR|nr:Alpha/Beta hydrolase protein [Mycena alexandri]